MKFAIVACTLVVLVCPCFSANDSDKKTNCNDVEGDLSVYYETCGKITCEPDGSWYALGCVEWQCAEGQIETWKETDPSKPWPECCGGPVCSD